MDLILASIYFILPAYFANMCPVIAGKLSLPLGKPIHEALFGSHKSWRGFYSGYIGALIILVIQFYLHTQSIFLESSLLDYSAINIFIYAALFGLGAITGDLIKSFFKRRIGKKPGAPWFPFDQVDLVFGSLLFLFPFFIPSWQVILTLFVITPILHFATNLTAYLLGLKKVWW